jgi:hypothetical protein
MFFAGLLGAAMGFAPFFSSKESFKFVFARFKGTLLGDFTNKCVKTDGGSFFWG